MFDFRNGNPLIDRLIPDGLSHAATSFVESLKINSITEKVRRDRRVVIKRRNVYGERAADLINFYFSAAGIQIRYLSDVREWRRWEARCFQTLNGDRFRAKVRDSRTVTLDKLPGDNLWDHMSRGTLKPRMLKAAGSEYRRAHHFKNEEFGNGWSHGDASMTNVICDEKTERARLIDFAIRPEKSLPATARHADDLLVFVLDLVSRVSSRQLDQVSDLFSARLRRCRCHARIKKTSRRSDRPSLDLVECADQFYRKRKSKPAFSGVASRPRQAGRPALACDRFHAQKTATFD
jgi:tRNA A-37 threonylcarbamoyl transferase component Bud32